MASRSVAPHVPALGSNVTLGTNAVLLSLLSAPLYDGKHTVLARTHTQLQLSVVQGPGNGLLWSRPLFSSSYAVSGSVRVLAAADPVVSAKVIYALGASSADSQPELIALAGQSGADLWTWAPPAGEGGEPAECPVAIAGSEREGAIYVASVGVDAGGSRSPAQVRGDNSSGGGGSGGGSVGGGLLGGGLSIWRLSLAGGSVAWRIRLYNTSHCVPLAMVLLPRGGVAVLSSNSTHLLLTAIGAAGPSLWDRSVSAQPQAPWAVSARATSERPSRAEYAGRAAGAPGPIEYEMGGVRVPGSVEYERGWADALSLPVGSGTAVLVVPSGAASNSAGTGGAGASNGAAEGGDAPSLRADPGDAQSDAAGGGLLIVLAPDQVAGWPSQTLSSFHASTGAALASIRLDTLLTAPAAGCLPPVYNAPQALVALACATLPTGAQLLQFSVSGTGSLLPVTAKAVPLGPDSAELLPQRLAIDAAGTVLVLMRANATADEALMAPRAPMLLQQQAAGGPAGDGGIQGGDGGSQAGGGGGPWASWWAVRSGHIESSSAHRPASAREVNPASAVLLDHDAPTADANGTLLCSLRLPAPQNKMSGAQGVGPPATEPAFPPVGLPAGLLPPRSDAQGVVGVVLPSDGHLVAGGGSLLFSISETDACTSSRCHPIHGRCEVAADGTARCFCEANWLGVPDGWDQTFCGREYAPGSYSVPLWISFGVGAALLAFFAAMMCFVYRSLLWLRFRVKLAPVYDSLLYQNSMASAGRDAGAASAGGSRCGACRGRVLSPGSRHRPAAAGARAAFLPFCVVTPSTLYRGLPRPVL